MVSIDLESPTSEWITQRRACAILGRYPTVIQRLALIGEIRFRVLPGCPVRYSRADVERLARQAPSQQGEG